MYADHVRFHSCRPYIRASTDALIELSLSENTPARYNPRRACAARVTVLGQSVSVSDCLSVSASKRHQSDTKGSSATSARNGDFAKTTAFESEKLVLSRTTLGDPAHQFSGVSMRVRIYRLLPLQLAAPHPALLPVPTSGPPLTFAVARLLCLCH